MRLYSRRFFHLIARKDFDGAIELLQQSLKNEASDIEALEMMALCHMWAGRQADAITACHEALKIEPSSYEAHALLASLHAEQGDHFSAAVHARQGLEHYPEPLPPPPKLFVFIDSLLRRLLAKPAGDNLEGALKEIENRRAEWYGWARQYLDWHDATYGTTLQPRDH